MTVGSYRHNLLIQIKKKRIPLLGNPENTSFYSGLFNKEGLKLCTKFWYLASSMNGPWSNHPSLLVYEHIYLAISEDGAMAIP